MSTQKLRDMNLNAVADELEQLRAFKAEVESQKPTAQILDSPAQVNQTVYGVGIEHSVVINAAQRYYQHKQEPSPDTKTLAIAQEDMRKLIADKPAVAVPTSIISDIEFALNAIYNETAMQVCCGRPGKECCGSPDVDWPSWATEATTKLASARELLLAAAPSHSQQSATESVNVWESALIEAAQSVVRANQSNAGYEPSRSLLAYRIDELRKILDDANVDYPGYTDRCPIHDSEQIAEGTPSGYTLVSNELIDFLHGKCAFNGKWFGDAGRGKFWWRDHLPRVAATDRCPSHESEQTAAQDNER